MKKLFSFFAFCIFTFQFASAQNVGIGTSSPQAALDVSSTTNGFLPPRMTYALRNAIVNPAQGLMIYCTNCGTNGGEPQFYNGRTWLNINGNAPSPEFAATLPRVKVGTQIWSSKNLDVVTYRNGDSIPKVTDFTQWKNLTTGAWCWYKNDSTNYAATLGRLYNGYAVKDPRGLAPDGWLIPSDADWNLMLNYLEPTWDTTNWTNTPIDKNHALAYALASEQSRWLNWQYPVFGDPTNPQTNFEGGSNTTGFSAFPSESRNANGSDYYAGFDSYGQNAFWWSTGNFLTNLHSDVRYDGPISLSNNIILKRQNIDASFLKFGYSVRVIRDSIINPALPTLSTTVISDIHTSYSTSGGNITSDGGSRVTARGICWSTSINPTADLSTKTFDGTGTGAFTSSITGLTANTTYYVRAYATNSLGTAYGTQQTFTTTNTTFVNLPSVTIGSQIWSSQNLSVATYRNGDPIPQVTDATQWANLTTGAWCWYNNDSVTYAATYGRLYNWYAVNDPRGLAPMGWHVPSDAEWNKLVKCIDPSADTTIVGYQNTTAGGGMKEPGTSHWNSPNTGATNSSGFAGLPGGSRLNDGTFYYFGNYGFWWSSTEYFTYAWYRYLTYNDADVTRYYTSKALGFSVRLVRD